MMRGFARAALAALVAPALFCDAAEIREVIPRQGGTEGGQLVEIRGTGFSSEFSEGTTQIFIGSTV